MEWQLNKVVLLITLLLLMLGCAQTTKHLYEKQLHPLNSLQVNNWSSDIDFFHSELEKRHIDLYHMISKEDLESELSSLKESLPRINKLQLMTEMMKITRLIGDGHTLFGYWGHGYSRFPVYLKLFDEHLRVIKTTPELSHLIGKKLVSIDGIGIREVIERVKPVVQGVDNHQSLEHFLPLTINVAEVLYGLGVTKKFEVANFEFSDETEAKTSVAITSITRDKLKKAATESMVKHHSAFGEILEFTDGLWLSTNAQTKTAYIRFDSYPGWIKMLMFADNVNKHLDHNQTTNLIIDFRHNGGGNFFEGLLLAQMLVTIDGLDWKNGIYALIGKETFSAGVSNAAQYRQILNAKLVGEPTGGNPYGYQDADSFVLPNSNWPVQYSKRLFKMQDKQSSGLKPDIRIETLWSDYEKGLDRQLEWIINDIDSRKVHNKLINQDKKQLAVFVPQHFSQQFFAHY
jgi:hypothetical protein